MQPIYESTVRGEFNDMGGGILRLYNHRGGRSGASNCG